MDPDRNRPLTGGGRVVLTAALVAGVAVAALRVAALLDGPTSLAVGLALGLAAGLWLAVRR